MRSLLMASILLVGLFAAGCTSSSDDFPSIPGPPMPQDLELGPTIQVLILGDQGTQTQDQYDTAQAMKKVCDERGCDFALALGDNLYTVGPLLGTADPQFDLGFETPYAGFDMPFYMTLGNHDNGATGHVVVHGDYEVAYTYSAESSGKWQMPSRYYNQTFNEGMLEIWSVDGDTLTAGDAVGGIRLGPDIIYDRQPQIDWLKQSIEASQATWKVVLGHYQYTTDGYKGDGDALFKDAFDQAICDRVQFYFFGHQHELRWQAPVDSCGRTEMVNSGAGARGGGEPAVSTDLGIEEYFIHQDAGFWWVEFTPESMTGIAYGVDENRVNPVELFTRTTTHADLGW